MKLIAPENERILVAHADPGVRENVAGVLARTGYQVTIASDLGEALEMLAKFTQAQPDAGAAWLLSGGILASSARYPEAEEAFKPDLVYEHSARALTNAVDHERYRPGEGGGGATPGPLSSTLKTPRM